MFMPCIKSNNINPLIFTCSKLIQHIQIMHLISPSNHLLDLGILDKPWSQVNWIINFWAFVRELTNIRLRLKFRTYKTSIRTKIWSTFIFPLIWTGRTILIGKLTMYLLPLCLLKNMSRLWPMCCEAPKSILQTWEWFPLWWYKE